MSEQAIEFYGRKFFPHLTPTFQRLAVIAVLEMFQRHEKTAEELAMGA